MVTNRDDVTLIALSRELNDFSAPVDGTGVTQLADLLRWLGELDEATLMPMCINYAVTLQGNADACLIDHLRVSRWSRSFSPS